MKPNVERLFTEAAELPERERTGFIAKHCGDDPVLCGKLERLLRAHDVAGGFLGSPTVNADSLVDADATVASQALPIPGVGSMVGR